MIVRLPAPRVLALWCGFVASTLLAVGARAERGTDSLSWAIGDPVRLRHALVRLASRPGVDSLQAGDAWSLAGLGYQRASHPDSALDCFARAVERRYDGHDVDALVEALFTRRRAGDLERAHELLRRRGGDALVDATEREVLETEARTAWAFHLDGHPDSAIVMFASHQQALLDESSPSCWMWRERMATTALAAGHRQQAIDLLRPLVVHTRRQDPNAMSLLRDALGSAGAERQFAPYIRSDLVRNEAVDNAILGELLAVSSNARARDGFPVSGVRLTSAAPGRPRAVVILMDHDDILSTYDSLATHLRASGWTVLIVWPRGSGRSLGPACPGSSAWIGREEELEHAVALDVRDAFDGLARATAIDTTRYLLVGSGGMAGVAVEAATLDRRVGGLVLVSPLPPPTERGRTRARLAAIKLPVFFLTAPTDIGSADVAAHLYEAVSSMVSRVVDSTAMGSGVMVFRFDPGAWKRLQLWLEERWPKTPHAPRPTPRPKG